MSELILFELNTDRERAIDVLLNAGETYSRVPKQCFLVSNAAVDLLRTTGVSFQILGQRPNQV